MMYNRGDEKDPHFEGDQANTNLYGTFEGFPYNNALIALFGLVSYNDPCTTKKHPGTPLRDFPRWKTLSFSRDKNSKPRCQKNPHP